jgi:serine/threonine protein kinase/tetratricopeptide (TPR) repeat protein
LIGKRVAHYSIVEKLGEGGMGVVYKAHDLRLERFVALKALAPHLDGSAGARARFLREARAISRLNHAHIVTIYDVEETDDQIFLVLEYLPGGTLRTVVREARSAGRQLPLDQVLLYTSQMGEALAHAHRNGIRHRDVKTANALLTAEGEVKLADFGLAKYRTDFDVTRPGARMGTLAYMAPEQAEGKDVDYRSDIFSFGVVLYELATGELPFEAEHEAGIIHQVVNNLPLPVRQRRPELPPEFERIVERAMAKKPEQRYQHMEDVLADLESVSERSTPASRQGRENLSTVTRPPKQQEGVRRRSHAVAWSLGAASTALLLALLLFWPRESISAVADGASVLLSEIENRTGDAQLDAVTDILRSQLTQSAHFNLVDAARSETILERMVRSPGERLKPETAREVAWRAGSALVVLGSVAQLGADYVLNLQIEKLAGQPRPAETWYRSFRAGGKSKLLDAIHLGSNWVRTMTGDKARDLARLDQSAEETTTNSWEALDLYSRALKLRVQGRFDDAILLLQDAVKTDPDFALAYTLLGDILLEIRRQGEGYRCYRKALSSMAVRRLTRREELRVKAMYANDSGDAKLAEALFRSYALYYPNDYYPLYYCGMTLEQQGREEEAIEQFRLAESKEPGHYPIAAHLAMAYLVQGRFTESAAYIERLRRLEQPHWADFLTAVSAFLRGDSERALAGFAGLSQSKNARWRSRTYSLMACLLAEQGKYREAGRLLGEGVAFDTRQNLTTLQADKLLALAYLKYRLREFTAVKFNCQKALALDASPNRLVKASALLARVGAVSEAEQLLPALAGGGDAYVFKAAALRTSGEILLARRHQAQALSNFREADALEPASRPREYLARALALTGDREGALLFYQKIVDSLRLLWRAPDEQFPGLWTDSLLEYAKLAGSAGKVEDSEKALLRYLGTRGNADPGTCNVAEARMLLAGLRSKRSK